MRKFYSALNDYIFKLIFGDQRNIEILTDFLKSVLILPNDEYDYLTIVDPHLKPEEETEKLGILDIKVHTTSGKIINVEIQVKPFPELPRRIAFYTAKMMAEQIRTGGEYADLRQTVCILITGHTLLPDEPGYRNEFSLRNKESGKEFTDAMKIIILEVPKLPQTDDKTEVWDWLRFMKSDREEELMDIAEKNPKLRKPVAVLMKLNDDERARLIFESQEKLRMDNNARLNNAYREGIQEGIQEGDKGGYARGAKEGEERLLETARKLKQIGLSALQISEATGLRIEEIEQL
jgi:predicted transposase/invertase (TIGR01784 family)